MKVTVLLGSILMIALAGCGGMHPAIDLGVTDQTAMIQQQVDQGGTVTFPAGTYVFSKTIVPRKSNTIIQGIGQRRSSFSSQLCRWSIA